MGQQESSWQNHHSTPKQVTRESELIVLILMVDSFLLLLSKSYKTSSVVISLSLVLSELVT